jgi:hypothetical protein
VATLGTTSKPAYVYDTETDTWVPIGVGAHTHDYIPNTLADAKGDLFVATADNTIDKLSVGNSGEQLVADLSTSTGLRYQAPKTQNAVYNSGFDIAQRGTSFTGLSGADYTLDRWVVWAQTGGQSNYASQQSVGNLSVSPNQAIRYCVRSGRTAATTNTGTRSVFQTLETADSVRFAGQTVTLSFYARAGANYSALLNLLDVNIVYGTGTDQIYYSFTGFTNVVATNVTLSTSWQRFSVTGSVATTATEMAVRFGSTPVGTAGAADYFEITGVQLEVGSVATPYNRQNGTIQGELAACRYYYERILANASGYGYSGVGHYYTTTNCYTVQNWQQKRTYPTVTFSSQTAFTVNSAGTNRGSTAAVADQITTWGMDYYLTTAAVTAGNSGIAGFAGVGAYIEASAEL